MWYNKFKEQNDWIEKTDSAYQIQIKAQKAAEEAMNQLQFYMKEEDKFVFKLIYYLIKSIYLFIETWFNSSRNTNNKSYLPEWTGNS